MLNLFVCSGVQLDFFFQSFQRAHDIYTWFLIILISSVESKKGTITIQRCSVESQKDAIDIQFVQR